MLTCELAKDLIIHVLFVPWYVFGGQ